MTTIRARVVEDSVSPDAVRLASVECRYPLVIHAELMTHRVFSRNARSSRAVPIERMIAECMEDPFIPLHWGAAARGMVANDECNNLIWPGFDHNGDPDGTDREKAWLSARDEAVRHARGFMNAGYAKQVVNRLLAPFLHIDTLVTSAEWDNFFKLRLASDAEPHMRLLARHMGRAMAMSSPKRLEPGQWHLPYVNDNERATLPLDITKKLSTARAARISYEPFDGDGKVDSELRRYDGLAASGHWSPFEHQATPDQRRSNGISGYDGWWHAEDHGNLRGWRQNRRFVEHEREAA